MNFGKHNASTATSFCLPIRQVAENALGNERDRDRFWAKVHISAPEVCCEWTASKWPSGYGQFAWASQYGREAPKGAHRCAWEMTFGAIPKGQSVLHSCDNPGCVNPSHLFLGTHDDNMADAVAKGRYRRARPRRRKLTTEQVLNIRQRVAIGQRGTANAVAREFGVSRAYISRLMRGTLRQYDAPLSPRLVGKAS